MEWYRWDNLETAQACLEYINGNNSLPITGVNSLTKEAEPAKQKTVKWADEVVACTDGKFGFPRLTQEWLSAMNVTYDETVYFMTTFNPTIEQFNSTWIDEPEYSGNV